MPGGVFPFTVLHPRSFRFQKLEGQGQVYQVSLVPRTLAGMLVLGESEKEIKKQVRATASVYLVFVRHTGQGLKG